MNILFIGQQWLGSNARGLAHAFRSLGHLTSIVDESTFVFRANSMLAKGIRRIARRLLEKEFNEEVLKRDQTVNPDLVVVFKGEALWARTLRELKCRNRRIFLFYPDVSMFVHGRNIPKCLPLYDWIFTTKSFGLHDLKKRFGIETAEFIAHGFDPDVHRPVSVPPSLRETMCADVSFIGTWSPKKEDYLSAVVSDLSSTGLAVWGEQWERCRSEILKPHLRGTGVLGDLYAACITGSKINLAILSEVRAGASSGDLITSRTFHIPAAGGFMLHERTTELLQHYQEGVEVACFDSPKELIEKISYYLRHEQERETICAQGHARCVKENGLAARAQAMLRRLDSLPNHT